MSNWFPRNQSDWDQWSDPFFLDENFARIMVRVRELSRVLVRNRGMGSGFNSRKKDEIIKKSQ